MLAAQQSSNGVMSPQACQVVRQMAQNTRLGATQAMAVFDLLSAARHRSGQPPCADDHVMLLNALAHDCTPASVKRARDCLHVMRQKRVPITDGIYAAMLKVYY
jgi:hypothetical protein